MGKQPPTNLYPLVKGTFTITYIFLVTTGIVIFIEALRQGVGFISHVMNLETAISVVAAYFYGLFMAEIEKSESLNQPIDWNKMIVYRYIDWSITTPIMLLVLCLYLANNIKLSVKLGTYIIIVVLNYIMLSFGYLGEIGVTDRTTGVIGGFAAFGLMYFIIYQTFMKKYNFANFILFWFYAIVWSFYGIVYMLDNSYKIPLTNLLDLISKCFVGLGLWAYYTKILTI
tara:strand:- start:4669 stop:5352 length:684 start_codon:yes stop_codon:yes gene_type:complete